MSDFAKFYLLKVEINGELRLIKHQDYDLHL